MTLIEFFNWTDLRVLGTLNRDRRCQEAALNSSLLALLPMFGLVVPVQK